MLLPNSLATLSKLPEFNSASYPFPKKSLEHLKSVLLYCKDDLLHNQSGLQETHVTVAYTLLLVGVILSSVQHPVRFRKDKSTLYYLHVRDGSWVDFNTLSSTFNPAIASSYPQFLKEKAVLFNLKESINHDEFIFI